MQTHTAPCVTPQALLLLTIVIELNDQLWSIYIIEQINTIIKEN